MSNKKDKNEVNEVDEKLDTALLDAITVIENLDTEIEDITDENGKLDQAMYTFLQCFNSDKFNNQTHLQWEINFTKQCNELGIERRQKNVAELTKAGTIKPNLKQLEDKMGSRVSKIKRFQSTTVSNAQAEKNVEPIGKEITKATKWYDIVKAVAPVVDQNFLDKIKAIKKWSIEDIDDAIEFNAMKHAMELVDDEVQTTDVYDDWAKDLKNKFKARQIANELEKNAQVNAK